MHNIDFSGTHVGGRTPLKFRVRPSVSVDWRNKVEKSVINGMVSRDIIVRAVYHEGCTFRRSKKREFLYFHREYLCRFLDHLEYSSQK